MNKTKFVLIILFYASIGFSIDPFVIISDYQTLAKKELWPNFHPASIPIAVYDGKSTFLLGHPKPPVGFTELKDHPGIWSYPGLYSTVRSNTSAEIEGIATATAMLSDHSRASLIIHETFHVFERAHHPKWVANEVDLFTYPREDAKVLQLQRLETEALRRALLDKNPDCWTKQAILYRRERYKLLPPTSAAYERGNELNEGLAQYVEYASDSRKMSLPGSFEADNVRTRLYDSGQALATLLDHFDSHWKEKMEAESAHSLDELLDSVLPKDQPTVCGFSDQDQSSALQRATSDIAMLQKKLDSVRSEFFQQPGWQLVVIAGKEPLWPNGFDPWNVEPLRTLEVLHSRWLKLGNSSGSIEVMNLTSLTEGVGPHPLFNGVHKITITGLKAEPKVMKVDNKISFSLDETRLEFINSRIDHKGKTVTIYVQ